MMWHIFFYCNSSNIFDDAHLQNIERQVQHDLTHLPYLENSTCRKTSAEDTTFAINRTKISGLNENNVNKTILKHIPLTANVSLSHQHIQLLLCLRAHSEQMENWRHIRDPQNPIYCTFTKLLFDQSSTIEPHY